MSDPIDAGKLDPSDPVYRSMASQFGIDIAAERDALAARVEELEARIARAEEVLLRGSPLLLNRVDEARRILRGEDER